MLHASTDSTYITTKWKCMQRKESTTKWFQIQNGGHNPSCLYKKMLAGNLYCSPSPPHFVAEIWRRIEFTHFNLVIRLSKGQQSALRFISLFESPAAPIVPCDPRELHSSSVTLFETIRNLLLFAAAFDDSWQQHLIQESGRHTTFRCGDSFFWWLSGEVKHFVHLIRWNLKAVLCPCGWLEHGPGLAQRTTFRFRSWILSLINCFGFLACH